MERPLWMNSDSRLSDRNGSILAVGGPRDGRLLSTRTRPSASGTIRRISLRVSLSAREFGALPCRWLRPMSTETVPVSSTLETTTTREAPPFVPTPAPKPRTIHDAMCVGV
jgi:hypothetical protein